MKISSVKNVIRLDKKRKLNPIYTKPNYTKWKARRLRAKDVASVKAPWRNNSRKEMTCEPKEERKKKYDW